MDSVLPLPGAQDLLGYLNRARRQVGPSPPVATRSPPRPALKLLGLPESTPMVTRDLVRHAKPDPDLFLAAAALLGVEPRHAMVVGDSVWDLLAARRGRGAGDRLAVRRLRPGGNWSGPAPTGSTATRPICWPGSTRSGCAARKF